MTISTKLFQSVVRVLMAGIFIILTGCHKGPATLKPGQQIHVSFAGPKTSVWSFSDHIFTDNDKDYFAFASSLDKKLYLVNIENNKVEHSISLNRLAQATDFSYNAPKFYIYNLDSIFILPDESKKIFLIGRNGAVKNMWDIQMNSNYDFVLSGFYTSPMCFDGGKIHVRFVPRVDPFREKKGYYSIPPEIDIDVHTNKITRSGGWPEKYLKQNFYNDYPFVCNTDKGDQVYSFAADDNLYVYRENKLVKKFVARSDKISRFNPYIDDSIGNIAYTMRYLITSPRYGKVIYDQYHDLYYRLALHATKYETEDGLAVKRNFDQPWSLIILNGKYQKINEIPFDPSKYAWSPIYLTKDGLLIPKRNLVKEKGASFDWDFQLFEVSL